MACTLWLYVMFILKRKKIRKRKEYTIKLPGFECNILFDWVVLGMGGEVVCASVFSGIWIKEQMLQTFFLYDKIRNKSPLSDHSLVKRNRLWM